MIFPRIRDNLRNDSQLDLQHDGVKDVVCRADGYPEVDVAWIRGCAMLVSLSLSLTHIAFSPCVRLRSVADTVVLARNLTRATLNFDHETHGVNKYVCEAKNKHGLTKIFLTVIIPGVYEPHVGPRAFSGLRFPN